MKRTITLIAAGALLALGACNKKSENPPPSAGASGATMAAGSGSAAAGGSAAGAGSGSATGSAGAAGSGSAAAAADVDVPTEVDFEDDAAAKITDKNVETQVQALEKQLDQK